MGLYLQKFLGRLKHPPVSQNVTWHDQPNHKPPWDLFMLFACLVVNFTVIMSQWIARPGVGSVCGSWERARLRPAWMGIRFQHPVKAAGHWQFYSTTSMHQWMWSNWRPPRCFSHHQKKTQSLYLTFCSSPSLRVFEKLPFTHQKLRDLLCSIATEMNKISILKRGACGSG